jgi:hypothetical protein
MYLNTFNAHLYILRKLRFPNLSFGDIVAYLPTTSGIAPNLSFGDIVAYLPTTSGIAPNLSFGDIVAYLPTTSGIVTKLYDHRVW